MKTMSPREFVFFLLGVVVFIAGCVFVGMHISLPKMPLGAAAVITVGLFLLWLCVREMICVPLRNSFLVGRNGMVIEYYSDDRFIRTRVLEERGCWVVPHVLGPVHGKQHLQVTHEGQVVQVSVNAIARANMLHLQEYFNSFLCDKWVHPPEKQLNRLLADFLAEHSEWMSGGTIGGHRVTVMIENKLSDWLDERLPLRGLYCSIVGCRIDTVIPPT